MVRCGAFFCYKTIGPDDLMIKEKLFFSDVLHQSIFTLNNLSSINVAFRLRF